MWAYFLETFLPTINTQDSLDLDKPLVEPEFLGAIKGLKTGKCPGLDGYTPRFYKTCHCYSNTWLVPFVKTLLSRVSKHPLHIISYPYIQTISWFTLNNPILPCPRFLQDFVLLVFSVISNSTYPKQRPSICLSLLPRCPPYVQTIPFNAKLEVATT